MMFLIMGKIMCTEKNPIANQNEKYISQTAEISECLQLESFTIANAIKMVEKF